MDNLQRAAVIRGVGVFTGLYSQGVTTQGTSTVHMKISRLYIIQDVHFAGLLDVQNILMADTGIFRQTEGHSFSDHLVSGSVSVTPSSVIKASIVLCSVSL
jgi:hypothetical protein